MSQMTDIVTISWEFYTLDHCSSWAKNYHYLFLFLCSWIWIFIASRHKAIGRAEDYHKSTE